MVGRVSYLGRVKQGNYHTHVLYTIPNPNYTLPKPRPFIITYPIHHPTLGTQTGRVLPCASINTTLSWISTYPYPSIVIPYPSTYPTNHRKNNHPYIEYLPPPTPSMPTQRTYLYPPHSTFYYIPNLHFPTLYYCQGLIKYKAEMIYQIRPKLPRTEKRLRPKRFRAEMTQVWNERPENAVAVVEQESTCRVVRLIIWLSILFGCEYSGLLIYLL